jgi:predicted polyphosphate/ATP-dependent NAD kinase
MKKIGLIVNPVAGLGGRVGLKGSDGETIQQKALKLGAVPSSPQKAVLTLKQLIPHKKRFQLITYPYEMGAKEADEAQINHKIIGTIRKGKTTSEDTIKAARMMVELPVDIIVFVGGDGTARDVCKAIDLKIPTIGVPAGVKIHSGVFAMNPRKAGELLVKFINDTVTIRETEVMDIDEEAFRRGRVSAKLYGYLLVPFQQEFIQQAKCGCSNIYDDKISRDAIAEYVIENMKDEIYYLLGSGTTVKAITDRLNLKKTLLGVDLLKNKRIIAKDLNESQLLDTLNDSKFKIIVSPIGGQGYIFGRGNQQISPEIIQKAGRDNIIVIADKGKLQSIGLNQPLRVDTGNEELDKKLSGYIRVINGYNEEIVKKITT